MAIESKTIVLLENFISELHHDIVGYESEISSLKKEIPPLKAALLEVRLSLPRTAKGV
jgi:hypothetical protein